MARCPRLSLRLAQLAATLVAALLLASSVGGSDKATYYTPESDDLSGLVFAQATLWLSALWAAVDMLLAKVSPYRWAPLVMCRSLMDAIFSLACFASFMVSTFQLWKIRDNSHLANTPLISQAPDWDKYLVSCGLLILLFVLFCSGAIGRLMDSSHKANAAAQYARVAGNDQDDELELGRLNADDEEEDL